MVTRKWLSLALAPAVALALFAGVACGGDDSSPAASGSPSGSKASEVPAGAPHIGQDNLEFKPGKLTVKAGTKVYFTNDESAIHTVTINKKNESGNMKKGDIMVWTPATAGTYSVTCDYHPQMKATITVE